MTTASMFRQALYFAAVTLVTVSCNREGSVSTTSRNAQLAAAPSAESSTAPSPGQASAGSSTSTADVLAACAACQVRTQVCSCDQRCIKCLYGKLSDSSPCTTGLAYYHDACACLQQHCPADCPDACDR
jgi:hypothetical protein